MYHFEKFVDYVSGLLKIVPPYVVFVPPDNMKERYGDEVLAQFDGEENVIYLKLKDEYEMIDYYDLAYSMRLIWQAIVGIEFTDKSNQARNEMTQSEIDAHAFACIAIAIRFKKVTRHTIRSDVKVQEMLDKRIDELAEEYDIDICLIG